MSSDDVPRQEREDAPADRSEWWATLDDDALADETSANRRSERWLIPGFVLAVVLTFLVLAAHPGPLLP